MACHRRVAMTVVLLLSGGAPEAIAEDPSKKFRTQDRCTKFEPTPGAPQMPVGYIFGFADPTDPGDPCTWELTVETMLRTGKGDGRYTALNASIEIAHTFTHNFAIAVSVYGAATHWSGVTAARSALADAGHPHVFDRIHRNAFDGASVEFFFRLFERRPNRPFALTLSIEPRWSSVDNITGFRAHGYGSEIKMLADAVLSNGWYGAVNVGYALGTQRFIIPGAPWERASATLLAAGLATQTYSSEKQFIESIFVGTEVRYRALFNGLVLNQMLGHSLFAGPSLSIGFANERMLSIAWAPQVLGRSASGLGRFDLGNYERREFRMKFSTPIGF